MKKVDITKVKLFYQDVPRSGRYITAFIGQQVPCVEFVMRGDIPQPITYTPSAPILVCANPWIQFEPEAWTDMIRKIYEKMVELWNKEHGFED